ncbi:MAG: hypothetical protein A2V66_01110 [Ignavibacteria bacterium RBG_13_36_8]|nr:MAG: hypothetical protein A2V66_01110 [Ignavibacteria bacterium RBG_13_36_8]
MKIIYALLFLLILSFVLPLKISAQHSEDIKIIKQNFDTDPEWENVNNRVNCSDCPQRTQDFGWAPTNHNGSGPGEIGGTIWKSTTPAYYAMPFGKPLSFKDAFSASGKISVIAPDDEGFGLYLGFFGHERQGWRVWSSCGARIGQFYYNIEGYPEGVAKWHLDYKTGAASGAILNPDLAIPGDGSVHTWEFKYEPNVSVADMEWPDTRLPKYFPEVGRNIHTDSILIAFQKEEPSMTKEKLLEILFEARDKGLVDDWYRKGKYHLWNLEQEPENIKGRITFIFDGESVSYFLIPSHQEVPSAIDRFGFWNMQMYTGSLEFYVSDLMVNNHKIDLSQDPYWDELNNKITFTETDFHSRHNYGYSQTNWAGENIGEIGGRFWGTEVLDPLQGYYAVDIGELNLEDPIKFSGKINFVEGAVDGRMLIGYFNKEEKLALVKGEYKGNPPNQYLGLEVMDQTRYGYNITAVCSPTQNISIEERGPIYIPDRIQREFVFDYDPDAGVAGRITVTFGEEVFSADLTPEQRKVGATFNRFGLLNPRKGGKYVDVYFDDLSYSSRKSDSERERFKQSIIEVPYPKWGRKYQ